MRVRNLALAFVAVAAMALPARADVILTWHMSNFVPANSSDTFPPGTQIPGNDPLGPAILGNSAGNPLSFMPGETKYLQVAIQVNNNPPTVVGGQNQNLWGNSNGTGPNAANNAGNTLVGWGFEFKYPSIVINPFTSPGSGNGNNTNARILNGSQPEGPTTGFASTFPASYANYNMGGTAMGGADLAGGLGTDANGLISDFALVTVKVRAGNTPGSGVIQLADLNSGPSVANFGLADGVTNIDTLLFTPAHNSFPLFITVAVPEPSSMCLVGLAVAGIGWRKLRRKVAVVA